MKRTPLYDLHLAAQASWQPLADYEVPIQFPTGMFQEHLHTREAVSLFDISYRGQIEISGPRVQEELERLIPLDLDALSLSHLAHTVLTHENGGVIDSLVIARRNRDNFVLTVNAACKDRVIQHLAHHLQYSPIHILNDQALLAVQGPYALQTLLKVFPAEIGTLSFMEGMLVKFQRMECFVSRSGSTGEDGFEISIAREYAARLADKLLQLDKVQWAGFGAQNSLRLEAGLCLDGRELAEDISLVTAGLGDFVSHNRCEGGSKAGNFMGADIILHQLKTGTSEKRIGLIVQSQASVEEGASLRDGRGNDVGYISSAVFSPSLSVPIAMAYVTDRYATPGAELFTEVGGSEVVLHVCRLPFVAHRYVRQVL